MHVENYKFSICSCFLAMKARFCWGYLCGIPLHRQFYRNCRVSMFGSNATYHPKPAERPLANGWVFVTTASLLKKESRISQTVALVLQSGIQLPPRHLSCVFECCSQYQHHQRQYQAGEWTLAPTCSWYLYSETSPKEDGILFRAQQISALLL